MTTAASTTVDQLQIRFKDSIIKIKEFRDETYVCIRPEAVMEILTYLKTDEALAYTYFVECMGVDYSTWTHERDLPGRFEVVYNLFSLSLNQRIFIKLAVDDGVPVPSVKSIFLGAEYPEREIQDLYGVVFTGNEALAGQRFLLPDDWIGFPLRKEYPLGGEDVVFEGSTRGPAIEDISMPYAGNSFSGKTGTEEISGR